MGYVWVEDGLEDGEIGAGGRYEIGDATRGMQRHDMMGAQQLNQLRRGLQRPQSRPPVPPAVAERYGSHQPASREVPSQYRDSGQISINVSQTFAVSSSSFTSWTDVQTSGASTVYTSFKPNRIVLTEQVIATFTASGASVIVAAESSTASDIMLSGAFSGSLNTFPNAPSAATARRSRRTPSASGSAGRRSTPASRCRPTSSSSRRRSTARRRRPATPRRTSPA